MAMDNVIGIFNKENEEEWVWVTGYKGTDENMMCRDYQYEIGKAYSIPDEEEVRECSNGFHLCKELKDVYHHYSVGRGNRFFEVRALVRQSDFEQYDRRYGSKKLAARAIMFVRELELDEIVQAYFDKEYGRRIELPDEAKLENWTDTHKHMAINFSIEATLNQIYRDYLMSVGYSLPFAQYIVSNGVYTTAKLVAAQQDLSMDMKAMFIYQDIQRAYEHQYIRDKASYRKYSSSARF